MPVNSWDQRFLATTRGRLLQYLRRRDATVDELARALDLTDNAIRAQLALLERDGLVCGAGQRRTIGSRKPSHEYRLTGEADRLFPTAYDHVLRQLLSVLRERMGSERVEDAAREVGRRIADEMGAIPTGDTHARLGLAADALNGLGGLAEVVESSEGRLSIQGQSCPFAAVAADHAEVCRLTETFIGAISGVAVCERCVRGPVPRCHFEVLPS